MNFLDYKTYINKLCIASNNYFTYDMTYIKNKYNMDTYNKFKVYFKKYYNDKLIFNSEKSEYFFIKIMNLDQSYINKKYGNNQAQIIIDFFIKQTNSYFNACEEITEKNKKTHLPNCKCKIKVKSVVNLSINALLFILMDVNREKKEQKTDDTTKVIKLYNNDSNKKLLECISLMEITKKNLGLAESNIIYELTDTKSITEEIFINEKNAKKNNIIHDDFKHEQLIISDIKDNTTSTKKYEEQLISESINLTDNISIKNKPTKLEKIKLSSDMDNNSLKKQLNEKLSFVLSESSSSSEKIEQLEKTNRLNRYGNVIIKEDKVKLEKKQLSDLKNSSDILVSYNGNDDDIHNNFELKQTEKTTNVIISSDESSTNSSNSSVSEHILEDEVSSNNDIKITKKENKESEDDEESEELDEITKSKKDVIEILNYLESNFNYITSDDILIDKDKKMQICTFMVEVKYKIFGLFLKIEKNKSIDIGVKNRISSKYEKIYQYVVQSNKIGSTGEMVEFVKHKNFIEEIIDDINEI